MLTIPTVFKRDASTGLVIPELNPECADWIQDPPSKGSILMTVLIDGVNCKLQKGVRQDNVILRRAENVLAGGIRPYIVCDFTKDTDKPFFEAMDNLSSGGPGEYVMYGPTVKGNPQGVAKHMMVKIDPIDSCLIMYGQSSGINRWGASIQGFYDTCRQALAEGDAMGVVFRLEEPVYHLRAAAKIKRQDFGLPWPLPVVTKKRLMHNCIAQIPITGSVYCAACRQGSTQPAQMKTCLGADCKVWLTPTAGDYCTSCATKQRGVGVVGYLTGSHY